MAFDSDHVSINFCWVNLFIILCLLSVRSVEEAWSPNTGSWLIFCSYFFLSFWQLTNVTLARLTLFLSSRVCQLFNTLGTFDFIKFFVPVGHWHCDNYRIHRRKILGSLSLITIDSLKEFVFTQSVSKLKNYLKIYEGWSFSVLILEIDGTTNVTVGKREWTNDKKEVKAEHCYTHS